MFLLVPPAVLVITDDQSNFPDFLEFLRCIYTPWVSKVTELNVSKSQNKQQKKYSYISLNLPNFSYSPFLNPLPSQCMPFFPQNGGISIAEIWLKKKDFWVLHNFFPLTVWWQNTFHKCIGVEYTSERHKTNA